MNTTEELPKVNENTTNFENYKFVHVRDRDIFRKEYLANKAIEDEKLEKLSQEKNYTKKRKPVHDSMICYKSDNHDNDDYDYDDDDVDHGCMAKFNETVNIKSREASVFLPLDVFDKGNAGVKLLAVVLSSNDDLIKSFISNLFT